MVAINKILLPECTGEGRGGGTRNAPREARLHACSPFYFLLSPVCRRSPPTRDPIGYQGGINLYGYVNSSPVGSVDAEGTKWTITRDGKARATVSGQTGDTVVSLLATKDNHGNLILLDASQYKKWLRPVGGSRLPATATSPLKCDEKFTIPNTAYVDLEVTLRTATTLYPTLVGIALAWRVEWSGEGLDVRVPGLVGGAALRSELSSPDVYKFGFIGHGDVMGRGNLIPGSANSHEVFPGTYTEFGIASLRLYACYSAWPAKKGPLVPSPVEAWDSNVSKRGWLTGWSGEFNNLRYWFNIGRVRLHGSR